MFYRPLLLLTLANLIFLTACQKTERVSLPQTVAVLRIGDTAASTPTQQYTGQIRARYELRLAFRVSGKLAERLVEVGQIVEPGQLLARLDTDDYQIAVEAAEAEIEAAQAAHDQAHAESQRIADLFRRAMISQSDFDAAKASNDATAAQLRRARRMLELAKNRFDYCSLRAEHRAIVQEIKSEVGSVVSDGTPIFLLARMDELEANVSIPENRMQDLSQWRATVQLWADSKTEFHAKVREIAPTADPLTRTFAVRFAIDDPTPELRLGMTAVVTLHPQSSAIPISLPMSALIMDQEKTGVWVLDPSQTQIHYRPITIERFGEKVVTVTSGLQPGEWVVRAGVHLLQDQQTVRPWFGTHTEAKLAGN